MRKKVTVITMGQSPADPSQSDVYRSLSQAADTEMRGLLDGMCEDEMEALRPLGEEMFIVSTIRSGRGVQIAERHAMRLAEERLIKAQQGGSCAALILCTGHFEIPPLNMPVWVPEKILFSLFRAMGIKKLGAIVPEEGQKGSSLNYYREFSPIVHAASPYGPKEKVAEAAAAFRDSDVDIVLADCMGFTEALGNIISRESGKQVFVPRVALPALIKAVIS